MSHPEFSANSVCAHTTILEWVCQCPQHEGTAPLNLHENTRGDESHRTRGSESGVQDCSVVNRPSPRRCRGCRRRRRRRGKWRRRRRIHDGLDQRKSVRGVECVVRDVSELHLHVSSERASEFFRYDRGEDGVCELCDVRIVRRDNACDVEGGQASRLRSRVDHHVVCTCWDSRICIRWSERVAQCGQKDATPRVLFAKHLER